MEVSGNIATEGGAEGKEHYRAEEYKSMHVLEEEMSQGRSLSFEIPHYPKSETLLMFMEQV